MTFRSDSAAAISETQGPSRVVAILGMHRSGTSLLAGTLQECGLDLGAVSTAAAANEKGNRESWLLMALHEDLLRQAGGAWDRPPARHPGAVAGRLGLPAIPVHGELTFYDDRLRHQSTGGDPLPAEVSEVYAARRERAAPQAAAGGDS